MDAARPDRSPRRRDPADARAPAVDPAAGELTVGEVSARSAVTVSALRFYERQQLIESRRTVGNQRRYTRDVLRRIALIRIAQRVGIPLAEVRLAFAELPSGRTPTRADWTRLSARWRAGLDERIRCLQQLRDDFTDCVGCGCLTIDRCQLLNPLDVLAQRGPGPRRLLDPGATGAVTRTGRGSARGPAAAPGRTRPPDRA